MPQKGHNPKKLIPSDFFKGTLSAVDRTSTNNRQQGWDVESPQCPLQEPFKRNNTLNPKPMQPQGKYDFVYLPYGKRKARDQAVALKVSRA